MSRIYDNWERLVAAVVKREQIWQLCHQSSRSPTISSSSDSNSSNADEQYSPPIPNLGASCFPLRNTFGAILQRPHLGTLILRGSLRLQFSLNYPESFDKGSEIVMKKLVKKVKVKEQEFKEQMAVLANCKHENVAAPKAYYFSKRNNQIIIIYNCHTKASVCHMLQFGSAFCWRSRLKVAIGAARGIAHIHRQCGGELAHGNLKSSNIFLNSKQYGYVTDLGLADIMAKCGDELKDEISQENDVYNFGVLLLELLTGKSPITNKHIFAKVDSAGPDEWTSGLFDQRLNGTLLLADEIDMVVLLEQEYDHSGLNLYEVRAVLRSHFRSMDLEMLETLEVAKKCLAIDRPKMSDVVLMLENIATHTNPQRLDDLE